MGQNDTSVYVEDALVYLALNKTSKDKNAMICLTRKGCLILNDVSSMSSISTPMYLSRVPSSVSSKSSSPSCSDLITESTISVLLPMMIQ